MAIPGHLADGFTVQSNPHLVAITIGFSLLAAFLAGVAPAWQVARIQRIGEFGKSVTGSSSRQRLRSILVSTEIALAFILLAGTGMFLTSLCQLQQVDPGFRAESVLTGIAGNSRTRLSRQQRKTAAFANDVLSRIQQQPGVVAVAASSFLPFSGPVPRWQLHHSGKTAPPRRTRSSRLHQAVHDWLSRNDADSISCKVDGLTTDRAETSLRGCHRRRIGPGLLARPEPYRPHLRKWGRNYH